MHRMVRKYGLLVKVLAVVAVLLLVRWLIELFNLDVTSTSPMIGALVGGVTFTIALLFSGTLADFKESERIPGDLAASIKALYDDCEVLAVRDRKTVSELQAHIKQLLQAIASNFRRNAWNVDEVDLAVGRINRDVARLAKNGMAPQFAVRFRTGLSDIEHTSNRIKTITETTFIPAAYAIAELSVAALLVVVLFLKMDPYFEGLALIGVTSSLLVGLVLLIKDMDNPFEYGKNTYANVDMSPIFRLEENLGRKYPN